jgi:hypothetical protein
MKSVCVATIGSPIDYRQSLFSSIAQSAGYSIDWTNPHRADLVIYGSFANPNPKKMDWCPMSLSPWVDPLQKRLIDTGGRDSQPLRLLHDAENIRHDIHTGNYAISFDLSISVESHLRMAYWIELIDWSHEVIIGNTNPRYSPLLQLERLMQPLGHRFLNNPLAAAFLSSHLHEPSKTLFEAVNKVLPVTGFRAYFDKSIKNHHPSILPFMDFVKRVLDNARSYRLPI